MLPTNTKTQNQKSTKPYLQQPAKQNIQLWFTDPQKNSKNWGMVMVQGIIQKFEFERILPKAILYTTLDTMYLL